MIFLLIAGIAGLTLGLLLLFFPLILRELGQLTDQVIFSIEEGSQFNRLLVGIAQIVIGVWLIYTYFSYPQIWYLLYIGLIAALTGILFVFLPNVLNKLNEIGNILIFSGKEVGAFERIVYGVIIIFLSSYILFIYFTYPRR